MLLTLWSNRQVFLLSHQNGGSLMLKLQNFSLFLIILIIFGGCEPTINTQQITQSAQNLRENVRNIDTQRITQGAQNLRENLSLIHI